MSTSIQPNAPFRADIVGSFLRPQAVKDARAVYVAGKLDASGLKAGSVEFTRDIDGTGVLYSLRTKKAADDIGAKRRVRLNRSAHRYLPLHWLLYWDRV